MSKVATNNSGIDFIRVRPMKITVILTAISAIVFFVFSISAEPRALDSEFVMRYGNFLGKYLRNIIALSFSMVSVVALIRFRCIDLTNNVIRVRGLIFGKLLMERRLDDVVEVQISSSSGARSSLAWLRSHVIIFNDRAKINIPVDYFGAAEAVRWISRGKH